MDLLQPGIDTVNFVQTSDQSYSVWFTFEVLVIVSVIIYQLYISWKIFKNIHELKGIFTDRLNVISGYIDKSILNNNEKALDDISFIDPELEKRPDELHFDGKTVKVSLTETSGTGIIQRIKEDINNYLLNNYGAAVNFSIIKDIIDREVDVKDEEISNSVPTPLYFGLAATMVGIIFGLISMPGLDGDKFSLGINSLINGVKLAMTASLCGLLCTTLLSSIFYKNAKRSLLKDKNQQISYLQATLLPELIKAEDTGVSGLKASLDRFARVATDISDNVLIAARKTGENILLQQEVIDRVANLDVLKISKTNLELFNRLENNMIAFNKFSEYISIMSQISDNLKNFASRTISIDNVVAQIYNTLQENDRLSRFLSLHFEKIETAGNAALKAVDLSDSHFKEAIEKLKEETDKTLNQAFRAVNESSLHFSGAIDKLKEEIDNRISRLNHDAADNETKMTGIYNDIGANLASVASQHISQLQTVYSNALPQFDQLNNLQILPKIKDQVSDGVSQLQNDSNTNTARLIEAINQLNNSLTGIRDNLNNSALSKKTHRSKPGKPGSGFFRKLRNPVLFFRRKRNAD